MRTHYDVVLCPQVRWGVSTTQESETNSEKNNTELHAELVQFDANGLDIFSLFLFFNHSKNTQTIQVLLTSIGQ